MYNSDRSPCSSSTAVVALDFYCPEVLVSCRCSAASASIQAGMRFSSSTSLSCPRKDFTTINVRNWKLETRKHAPQTLACVQVRCLVILSTVQQPAVPGQDLCFVRLLLVLVRNKRPATQSSSAKTLPRVTNRARRLVELVAFVPQNTPTPRPARSTPMSGCGATTMCVTGV